MNSITYGIGGELPDHPNGNIVERIIDNGDGTGVHIRYADDGTESSRTTIEVPLEPPAPLEGEAELLDRAEAARRSAYDAVMAAGPRSMSRLEDADQAGSEAFRAVLRGEA